MGRFIRIIGDCSFNGFGFDVYENKNGSATIRPTKFGNHMPTKKWINYESIEKLESALDQICGDSAAVDRVRILIKRFISE